MVASSGPLRTIVNAHLRNAGGTFTGSSVFSSRAALDDHSIMPLDVLIVDDSTAIRKILQRVLQKAELPIGQVFEAGDGCEALAIMERNSVGLVLSDINMPNMDGLQLLSRLKANETWKAVPVVMITTEGSQAKVLEAVEKGAAGYVRKPFTPDQIKDKLSGIV